MEDVLGLRIAPRVRQSDASPAALHRHDGALRQVRLMFSDGVGANGRLLQVAKIHEPDDSCVCSSESYRELAEVLVERYEYLAVAGCVGEDFVVAWVGAPVSDPLHLMPGPLELRPCAGPDAAIEQ